MVEQVEVEEEELDCHQVEGDYCQQGEDFEDQVEQVGFNFDLLHFGFLALDFTEPVVIEVHLHFLDYFLVRPLIFLL